MKSQTFSQQNLARRSISGQTKINGPGHQRVYDSIVDLIANPDNPTPMVKLSERYNPAPEFDLFIKLESFNPFGSIKDRTALYLLRGTHLEEGQVLAEPTAGNTGIALAALSNAQGTPIELAVPEATPEEKKPCYDSWALNCLKSRMNYAPCFPPRAHAAW